MDSSLLRVLSEEVRSRRCPGCGGSLRAASVSAEFTLGDIVAIRFSCGLCVFEGGGEIEMTGEMRAEANRSRVLDRPADPAADPVSADEVLAVHEALGAWGGGLTSLIAR